MRTILSLIIMLMCLQASAQTVKKQRLIAIMNHPSIPSAYWDTIFYSYSGERGMGEFQPYNFAPSQYIYSYYNFGFGHLNGLAFSTLPAEHMPEPVADIYDINIFPDVVLHKNGIINKRVNDTAYYTYEGNNLIKIKSGNIEINNSFNISNRVLVSTYAKTYMGYLDQDRRKIGYDEQQRVLGDTLPGGTDTRPAQVYTYNANGNVSKITTYTFNGGLWFLTNRVEYAYNTNGKITDVEAFYMATNDWKKSRHQIFTYDDDARLTAAYEQYDTIPVYHLGYSGNSKLADTLVSYYRPDIGTLHCKKTIFYYNSFGYPDSAITQTFTDCINPYPIFDKTYYTYETYEVDTTTDNGRFFIYPNPADKQITIRWSWKQPKEPVYMQVYNSIGREVLKSYIPKTNKTETLDVSSFPPGVYILRIRTESGKKVHREKFTVYN